MLDTNSHCFKTVESALRRFNFDEDRAIPIVVAAFARDKSLMMEAVRELLKLPVLQLPIKGVEDILIVGALDEGGEQRWNETIRDYITAVAEQLL